MLYAFFHLHRCHGISYGLCLLVSDDGVVRTLIAGDTCRFSLDIRQVSPNYFGSLAVGVLVKI